jgi:hypothetical protein
MSAPRDVWSATSAIAGAVMAIAAVVGLVIAVWPSSTGPSRPTADVTLVSSAAPDSTSPAATELPPTVATTMTATTISVTTTFGPTTTTTFAPPAETVPPPPSSIFIIDYDDDPDLQFFGPDAVNGRTFAHSISICDCNGGTVRFELANQFSTLAGHIGVTDGAPTGMQVELMIESEDGVLLREVVSYGEDAREFAVDVTGALRLDFTSVALMPLSYSSAWGVFGDVVLVE